MRTAILIWMSALLAGCSVLTPTPAPDVPPEAIISTKLPDKTPMVYVPAPVVKQKQPLTMPQAMGLAPVPCTGDSCAPARSASWRDWLW